MSSMGPGSATLFDPESADDEFADPATGAPGPLARLRVHGLAKPQGSKVPFINRNTGRAGMKEQGEVAHKSWRNDVSAAAAAVRDELGYTLDGPLALEVTFRFPMPASRTKKARAAGMCFKETAPDTSKLVRAVEDSLEAAGLIANDARFAIIHAAKVEVADGWTGADITIRRPA